MDSTGAVCQDSRWHSLPQRTQNSSQSHRSQSLIGRQESTRGVEEGRKERGAASSSSAHISQAFSTVVLTVKERRAGTPGWGEGSGGNVLPTQALGPGFEFPGSMS